jgi:hypothetical protein
MVAIALGFCYPSGSGCNGVRFYFYSYGFNGGIGLHEWVCKVYVAIVVIRWLEVDSVGDGEGVESGGHGLGVCWRDDK